MKPTRILFPLCTASLLAACASRAPEAAPDDAQAAAGCAELKTRRAAADETRREAEQKKQDAWKAIVPFAVAARRVQAGQALEVAEREQAALAAAAQKQRCGDGA